MRDIFRVPDMLLRFCDVPLDLCFSSRFTFRKDEHSPCSLRSSRYLFRRYPLFRILQFPRVINSSSWGYFRFFARIADLRIRIHHVCGHFLCDACRTLAGSHHCIELIFCTTRHSAQFSREFPPVTQTGSPNMRRR